MKPFQYLPATTIEESRAALRQYRRSRLLAGGTDLLTLMKHDLDAPETLVRLPTTDELRTITILPDGGIRIGAQVTLAELERSEPLTDRFPLLRQAVRDAATPQLRNRATVGGNLAQHTRCWYYRSPLMCWHKGSDTCYAREGENKYSAIFEQSPCIAVHPSDLVPALIALDASVTIEGDTGRRSMALADFMAPPEPARRRETRLQSTDVIIDVGVPAVSLRSGGAFLKMMDRHAWAFAMTSAAVQLSLSNGNVSTARIVLGAVANVPVRATVAEAALTGHYVTPELAARAGDLAMQGATPFAHNGYKVPQARELVRRAILAAFEMASQPASAVSGR